MPIAFMLMFVYVFGGAIDIGAGAYVDYLLPGILLRTVASGVAYTAPEDPLFGLKKEIAKLRRRLQKRVGLAERAEANKRALGLQKASDGC